MRRNTVLERPKEMLEDIKPEEYNKIHSELKIIKKLKGEFMRCKLRTKEMRKAKKSHKLWKTEDSDWVYYPISLDEAVKYCYLRRHVLFVPKVARTKEKNIGIAIEYSEADNLSYQVQKKDNLLD